jgi:hypothetical protein
LFILVAGSLATTSANVFDVLELLFTLGQILLDVLDLFF